MTCYLALYHVNEGVKGSWSRLTSNNYDYLSFCRVEWDINGGWSLIGYQCKGFYSFYTYAMFLFSLLATFKD